MKVFELTYDQLLTVLPKAMKEKSTTYRLGIMWKVN